MISVQEALEIVLSQKRLPKTTEVPIEQSLGKVLAVDLLADRSFPPFDRITMDGIAVAFDKVKNTGSIKIEGVCAAGKPQQSLTGTNTCLEVMTGAVLPKGTDTVIPYEHLAIDNGIASINPEFAFNRGQNIHQVGSDHQIGDLLIKKGTRITPAIIGICATVGLTDIKVFALPKTVIVSTGDELVPIDQVPKTYQIRMSNTYQLQALLTSVGLSTDRLHLSDDLDDIKQKLGDLLAKYELIILSGGVSKGKYDFIPDALTRFGVSCLFHRVAQRPGKPFWFGKRGEEGPIVFAFPGNPVSTFVCAIKYLLPWLEYIDTLEKTVIPHARLATDVNFNQELTYFLEVEVKLGEEGILNAWPVRGSGSGDLANLGRINGFMELPASKSTFKEGELYPFLPIPGTSIF